MRQVGVGRDLDERTFEFTDRFGDVLGDEQQDVVGDLDRLRLGLLRQDRDTSLEVRALDVGDETPLETAPKPILERRHCVRGAVRREHDLLVVLVEFVEGVEELLLETVLAFHELNVVDQEHIDVAVATFELREGVGADRLNELVQERFRRDVPDAVRRVVACHIVGDSSEKVRLAEAGITVDEQGVVARCWRFGDGQCGSVGKAVRRADDEVFEGEFLIASCWRRVGGGWSREPEISVRELDLGSVVGRPVGVDLDSDGDVVRSRFVDRVLHETEVAALDAFFL